MQGLATDNAPSPGVVVPHFIFAAISFFILGILMLFSGEYFLGYFFQPHLLAITHATALGWGTMIIFGALYQLIPVIFETALFSEKLAKVTFWLFGFGIIFLVYSFWTGGFSSTLPYASGLVFIAITLFITNVVLSIKKAEKKNIKSMFIGAATVWLWLTALLGLLIALNYKFNFLSQTHILYLKMHAHMGLAGWFLLLIMGAASTLIPMFLVSHQMNENKLKYAFYLINTGLLLLTIDWLFLHGTIFLPVYGIIITAGIFFFISYVHESYKKRLRRVLDVGMKHTMIAVISIIIPVALGVLASVKQINLSSSLYWKTLILYGFSILFVFITSIILGQTYKTIPFIIWLDKYKDLIGKAKTPLPKELYSEKIADWQLYSYLLSIVVFFIGIIISNLYFIEAGSILLLITSILYNINVFKIILHKPKSNE
ncbi:MAG: hypothetical protein B6D61_08775 [Bacteroidetes bacterium 4484_249]|nr:MAG: hypothetical protein B6D61_08775 [Bacteroidetes bacterium 4484_249]